MCGIAGTIGKTNKGEALIKDMVTVISHRGPDDAGYLIESPVMMGMRRLSIIDLGGGHQPIDNEDGKLTIVFNGEIYNYQELQISLKQKGHQFKTDSDTEVLIHLYEEYGTKMLSLLRGMFAFAIYDRTNKEVFIARDHFGIKPLYYLVDKNNVVAFGSEIKSLLYHPAARKEINEEALFQFLSYQYNPLQETFFKRIWKLPPGHYLKISTADQKITEKKYWAFEFKEQKGLREKHVADLTYNTLRDSVRAHMIADVPVGAFLSGGIDSAAIVGLMSTLIPKDSKQKINTFTVRFDNISEASEAQVVANHFKTNHTEINVSQDMFVKAIPQMMWHMDEPVADPSAVGLFYLAQAARQKVKVVLSGEGSDEFFGGYNIYREPFALNVLKIVPKFIRNIVIKPLANSNMSFFGKNYLQRFFTNIESRYIGNARVFSRREVLKLWRGKNYVEEAGDFEQTLPSSYSYAKAKAAGAPSDSAAMQFVDINHWLPGDILQKADKMTMAHSLELRVPFLDIKVAELAETIPETLKYKKGSTKYILRKAMQRLLPKESSARRKLGFPTALREWLGKEHGSLLTEMRNVISENRLIKKYYDMAYIMSLIEEHKRGLADHSRKIYLLYSLAVWHNMYFK